MGAWPDAATARSELRVFLNDGPRDHSDKDKKVLRPVDGVNATFETFEDRLLTDNSLLVFVDNVDVSATATIIDSVRGMFTLATPPAQQTTIRASYFFQFFLDSELDEALRNAAGEIIESDDITAVAVGFKNAAFNFAGYFAFTKQAIRWTQRMSEKFILEDSPIDAAIMARPSLFNQLAQSYYKNAVLMRDDYYKRHGRRFAPAYRMFKPVIPPIAPRR